MFRTSFFLLKPFETHRGNGGRSKPARRKVHKLMSFCHFFVQRNLCAIHVGGIFRVAFPVYIDNLLNIPSLFKIQLQLQSRLTAI